MLFLCMVFGCLFASLCAWLSSCICVGVYLSVCFFLCCLPVCFFTCLLFVPLLIGECVFMYMCLLFIWCKDVYCTYLAKMGLDVELL